MPPTTGRRALPKSCSQIAAEAGYDLDWSQVTGAQNDQASRDAMERRDFAGRRMVFDRIVQPIPPDGSLTPERVEQLRLLANMNNPPRPTQSASPAEARSARSPSPKYGVDRGRGR